MTSKRKAEPAPEPANPNEPQPAPVDPHAPDQPVVGEPAVERNDADQQAADELAERQAKQANDQPVNPNAPTYTVNPTPLDEQGNPVV